MAGKKLGVVDFLLDCFFIYNRYLDILDVAEGGFGPLVTLRCYSFFALGLLGFYITHA